MLLGFVTDFREPAIIRNIQPSEMIKSAAIKTSGYAISTISVLLLATVSLKSARSDPVLALCLAAGVVTSILGMLLRWWSYRMEEGKH